jgi:RNA polymerase sigma-70 factor (ECF subfamily)
VTSTAAAHDVELVESIRRGEQGAEAELYRRFAPRVYYLAVRNLRSREDAEDVRAETFLRVIQAIRDGRFRNPPALAGFILGSTHNVVREVLRRRSRGERPLADDEDAEPAAPEPPPPDPIAIRTLEHVASRLKPREREFLKMYYYDELPADEIARRLGIREERVRLVKSRVLKSFREMYTRLAGGERVAR